MAVTPSLQADEHLHDLLMAGTPARDTNFHEVLRREHEALAVEYWQPEQEPPPFKAPPPGYNLNCPPPKWGPPHQSARRPPPIDVRAEQSLDQLHREFLRTQRLWLARLLDAPLDLVRLLDAPLDADRGDRGDYRTLPSKAPPMKAPPFINAPPPPKHNTVSTFMPAFTLARNRWTTYPYLQMPVGPPRAMTSDSSSDSDATYGNLPDLIDDPYWRRRSRSPSTISRASTCIPSSTSAESASSRYDGPNTSE